ncbi:serine/threonine-protein kinase [Marilutibacter maris]|uniref:non-specific serine/threonine protein kinase n=1 Tax=Marilutibacter maris TaxID=1605891 RepID=A0A2U9T703_9GAMM|nr:serine/threonine-protein kinase [Lysobacter maris]AWV06734.1 serine/threonine protein kinase [Lysobacter maris]
MSEDTPASGTETATGIYARAELVPGTVLAGRFRIESLLGVGGMGVVYRATDLALDVEVAIKLLRPELAHRSDSFERFRSELLLARQVSDPHVVRIHDLARHQDQWLISMDYVDGAPLDRVLDRDGPFAVEDALKIARQLAQGLAAAHAKGVVHRDLKPANVLLDAEGNAYISDFGVARSLATSGLTRSGSVIGTPDYLSPEQARGDPVDGRSDLYALGLILYEMLSGKPPFSSGTMAEVLAQRMLRTPSPVTGERADVPAWIARLLDKLLRPQPNHRFQSGAEVITAIDRREVPRELHPGKPLGWALAATLAIATGLAAWWWWRDAPPDAGLPAVATSAPLQRLLVMPLTGDGGDLPAPRASALDAHLRDALAAGSPMAVVDGERTTQALRQLDPTGRATADIAALGEIAAARQILQPRLLPEPDGGWRLRARLYRGDAGSGPIALDGAVAATPLAALADWAAQATTRQALGLGEAGLALALPDDGTDGGPALDAYGAGLIARRDGNLEQALQDLQQATAAAPAYTAAWLASAETAQAIGEIDSAWDAIEQAQRSAGDAPVRLRRQLQAAHALLDGDAASAIGQWQTQLQATPDDTFAQLQLARAQGAAGDFAAAVTTAKTLTRRDGNDPRGWYELGKFSILSGDARHAVDEYLVRALVLYKRSRNTFGEAETVNALGIGYGRLGQTADAAEQYRKAVELRRAVGNRRGVATSLRNLAGVSSLTGHFDQAAEHLRQARALYTELGDRDGLAAIENELGLLDEERGDYAGALAAFRRALQSWQQAGDSHGSAQALNNIGFAHYQLGAYDDAQVYWQQATEAYRKLGSQTGLIRTAQNLGLLDTARGRWDKARQRLRESLSNAERQQMPEEAAVSRRNLAELALWQGHLGDAIDQAEAAGALFRQREDQRGMLDSRLLKAQALLAAHADDEAGRILAALETGLADAPAEQQAIAALLRAGLARREGDAARATEALRQARQRAATSGVRQLQLQIELDAARAAAAEPGGDRQALDGATAALGHAGLRLGWLELAMADAVAANDPQTALSAYREASGLLRNGDYRRAAALYRLAAEAHAAAGDDRAARTAAEQARSAQARLRDSLPEALRAGFENAAGNGLAAAPQRQEDSP